MPLQRTNKYIQQTALTIKLVIDQDPFNKAQLSNILHTIHVGRNQLQSAFKSLTGHPISQYILSKKMEAAGLMLDKGTLSEKEIAVLCGYKGTRMINSFGRAFKRVMTMTPTQWINRNNK